MRLKFVKDKEKKAEGPVRDFCKVVFLMKLKHY